MKILTVAIPCYNSEEYMRKAIDHALVGGEDVEVLVIDDGSQDHTLEIAEEYERLHPDVVRAIHQENKGHGGAVNTGIREAKGIYFKVCDSDDYLDYDSYMKMLDALRKVITGPVTLDVMITNYIYDKEGAKKKRMMRYVGSFPEDRVFTWDEIEKPLNAHRYVLMHSLTYRTELLRECGLVLPEHTFYVDNLFAYQPLPYCEKLYYMDVNLYHYQIGREDQSVNEKIMISRIDQQIRVNKMMIDVFTGQNWSGLDKNVRKYMMNYLNKIMTVTSVLLLVGGTQDDYEKKRDIWGYLKRKDEKVYVRLRISFLGMWMNMPGSLSHKAVVRGYKVLRRFIHFN